MIALKPCQHCLNGFVLDEIHRPDVRLKQCPECRGTGRIPDPAGKPVNFDRETALRHSPEDEADGIRMARHFGDEP